MPKFGFSEGVYNAKLEENGKREKVYVDVFPDSLAIYHLNNADEGLLVDTSQKIILPIPEETNQIDKRSLFFTKHSLDLDVLTFPLQYMPPTGDIPAQLGSSLSAALYLGYRGDDFRIKYKKTPLGDYKKYTNHFGHSFGIFAGFCASEISAESTDNQVAVDYDGVSLIFGGAFLVGINDFTVGFAVGFDHLLDKNKVHWIYQNKPWLGLTVGLSLN